MVVNISLIIVRTVSGLPEKRYVSTSLFFTSGILYTLYIESKNDITVEFDVKKLTSQNFQILVNLSELLQDSGEVGEMEYDIFKFHIKSLNTYEKNLIVCEK